MTDKDVKLETVYGKTPPLIGAPCAVSIRKNNKLKWDNKLDKIGGRPNLGVEAKITLYEVTSSGTTEISAEDFCNGYTGGTQLKIPAKTKYDCEVIFEGEFKYDVEADGHQLLDPIIIVQPPPTSMIFVSSLVLIASIIFAGMGYWIGFRIGSNQSNA